MSIHDMYGRLAERQEATEAARRFLYGLVLQLKAGEVLPEQLEELEDGGIKVNPLSEEETDAENP